MKIAKTNNRPLYILALVILIATFINAFFSTFNLLNLEIIPEIRYFSAVVLCPGLVIFCVIKIYKTESYFNKNWKKAMRIVTYLIWILTAIIFNLFNFLGLIWTSPTYSTTYKNSHYYLYVDNGWDRQENDIKLSKRKYIFESTRLHAQRFNELIEDESAYLKIIKEYGDSHENEAQKRKRLDSLDNIANKMADEMRHN